MNKNIIKKIIFIFGIIISFFAVFFDLYIIMIFILVPQLLLLLLSVILIISCSLKIFVLLIGLIIGINVVVLNKQYFNKLMKARLLKNLDIDKRVIELVIDKRFKN